MGSKLRISAASVTEIVISVLLNSFESLLRSIDPMPARLDFLVYFICFFSLVKGYSAYNI